MSGVPVNSKIEIFAVFPAKTRIFPALLPRRGRRRAPPSSGRLQKRGRRGADRDRRLYTIIYIGRETLWKTLKNRPVCAMIYE